MEKEPLNQLLQAAWEIQTVLEKNEYPFCFIGGLAVLRWGNPRTTRDVDLCLFTGFEEDYPQVDLLLEFFQARISSPKDFALRNRVLLLKSANQIELDVTLGGLPFEEEMIQRSTKFQFEQEYSLRTASAEDLILMKVFAGRTRDWGDVESIIARVGKRLDGKYIKQYALEMSAYRESNQLWERLETLLRK
jgi:hypothetical protein